VDLPSIRETKNLRVALESDEIAALMDACNSQSPIDIRDALIVILRGGGLRRAEVVKLELSDFKLRTGALEIRKGRVKTAQFICQNRSFVEEWLDIRGFEPGPLRVRFKGGQIELRQMTSDAVLKILRRRAFQAGVVEFSPHDFPDFLF